MGWFLWPGDKLCDWVGLTDPDDRRGFRTFANMIVWGVVIVGTAVLVGKYTS